MHRQQILCLLDFWFCKYIRDPSHAFSHLGSSHHSQDYRRSFFIVTYCVRPWLALHTNSLHTIINCVWC